MQSLSNMTNTITTSLKSGWNTVINSNVAHSAKALICRIGTFAKQVLAQAPSTAKSLAGRVNPLYAGVGAAALLVVTTSVVACGVIYKKGVKECEVKVDTLEKNVTIQARADRPVILTHDQPFTLHHRKIQGQTPGGPDAAPVAAAAADVNADAALTGEAKQAPLPPKQQFDKQKAFKMPGFGYAAVLHPAKAGTSFEVAIQFVDGKWNTEVDNNCGIKIV